MQHESIHLSLSHLGLGLPSLARSLPCLHAPYLALSLTPDRPLAGVTFIQGGWGGWPTGNGKKLQPGNLLGCCLLSFHFLWAIHPIRPVDGDSLNTLDVYKFMWCVHFVALVFAFAS